MKRSRMRRTNTINFRWIIALILAVMPFAHLSAQDEAQQETPLEIRQFDGEKLKEYADDPDFDYQVYKEVEKGAFQRFIDRVRRWWTRLWQSSTTQDVMDKILYLIGFIALIFFIIRLFGIESNSIFKPSGAHKREFKISEEELSKINFEEEIAKLLSQGLWKQAIRYIYLFSIKFLSDEGVITVKKDKTNYEYVYEISESKLRNHFADLSYLYDYTWYGHFQADEKMAKKAETHLRTIQRREARS